MSSSDATTPALRATETASLTPRDATGRLWRVVVIQEGLSKNNWNYPAAVLERDARVFEGVKVAVSWEALDHHDPVGALRNVAAERVDGLMAITADAEIDDTDAQRRLLEAYKTGRPYQFSIDAGVRATESKDAQGRIRREVTAILSPTELTIVRRGAAGGRVQRLVASEGGAEGVGGAQGAVTGVRDDSTSDKDNASAGSTGAESTRDEEDTTMAAPATAAQDSKPDGAADTRAAEAEKAAKLSEHEQRIKESLESSARAQKAAEDAAAKAIETANAAERRARESEFKALLGEKLADAKGLPVEAKARIRESFVVLSEDGKSTTVRVVEAAKIDDAIKAERAYLAKVSEALGAGRVTGCGDASVEVTVDQRDKWQAAMDGFFSGDDEAIRSKQAMPRKSGKMYVRVRESATAADRIQRFRSLHEAAEQMHNGGRRMDSEAVFHACLGGKTSSMRATEKFRARESIDTAQLANVLVDAIHRRLLKEYMLDGHVALLRRIASQITPIRDFRSNQRMRFGGYGLLNSVAEAGTYPTLTSPSDDKQSFTITKYGGIEDLTLEMIANDDVGAVQRIPTKLRQAAAETIFQTIFNNFANNSNIGDGSAIFRTANKTSSAFTKATMNAARKAMRQASPPNDTTKKIGSANLPKIWLGPADLEETADVMFKSGQKVTVPETTTTAETSTPGIPNYHAGVEPYVVDYWTDTADCLVMADPALMDTLEIGFYNGMEEPELFVQDMVNVGSQFDADKIKFKIRHIWGYLFPDFTPFYGFSRA